MLQLIIFAVIYGIMVFIWSFVYLNRSQDQVNQSFLYFLSILLLWMVLSVSNDYSHQTPLGLIVKTVYWLSMMNLSVFFLLFIYRLIKRNLDALFYTLVALNTFMIISRYFFPIDYANPTFWRLSIPVVAPLMSAIFSVPVVVAIFLVFRKHRQTKDPRQRVHLLCFFWGIGLACAVSVVSEYLLPTVLHINTKLYLMHVAILIFVIFTFVSIMKYRFLNIRSDYIFQKLFLNSSDGVIIINHNQRVISINNMAREVLKDGDMDSGDRITDYIPEYRFETNYNQHEVRLLLHGEEIFLTVTQYPIDTAAPDSVKLLRITDITSVKRSQQLEKNLLIEKSSIDPLTELYNKQYFLEKYCSVHNQQSDKPLSLMFIDVDNFKAINDQYGHLVGDRVLQSVAACFRNCLRADTDIIRFGGDEFIIIMKDTPIQDAYAVAERIRCAAMEMDLSAFESTLKITLSIGLIEGTAPVDDLLKKADMAMYRSKSKGKNRTTLFYDNDSDMVFRMKLS